MGKPPGLDAHQAAISWALPCGWLSMGHWGRGTHTCLAPKELTVTKTQQCDEALRGCTGGLATEEGSQLWLTWGGYRKGQEGDVGAESL